MAAMDERVQRDGGGEIETRGKPSDAGAPAPRLTLFGPGLIFALTVIGPGDVFTNAAAGTQYGYSLLWALLISLGFRYVWLRTSATYVLVTGESLLSGFARMGTWAVWVLLALLLIVRHFYNLYLLVVLGTSVDIFLPLPVAGSSIVWSLVFAASALGVMCWGGYGVLEYVFRTIMAFWCAAMVAAALWSRPDPSAVLRGILAPTLAGNAGAYGALFVLMALIGNEAGSMTNLSYAYFVQRRGWRTADDLKSQRLDLKMSILSIFVLCALLQIAAAGTLRPLERPLEGTEDLVGILSAAQGRVGAVVFGLGLWAATYTTLVGGTAGFALMLTDLCRRHVPAFQKRPADLAAPAVPERDWIYRGAVAFWIISPLYILWTGVRPVWLVMFVSATVVVLIPLLAAGLLWITNDRARMGEHRNGWLSNAALVTLMVASLALTFRAALGLLGTG